MPNRILSPIERKLATSLLASIRARLKKLANGETELLFAFRRKVYKELIYDERGKSSVRKKLKATKWAKQKGKCAQCGKGLPLKYSELDRKIAERGYTDANTQLVHAKCHHKRQAIKRYT